MGIAQNLSRIEAMEEALKHFKKVDTVLHHHARIHKDVLSKKKPTPTRAKLFESLCESVVSQQLSVKASDTIWGRVKNINGGSVTPDSLLATPLSKLKKAGLSASKAKTLKEIARAVTKGLDLKALKTETPEGATEQLTRIWGVGPWTSEMFLMFGLGHADIFSYRDLGLVRSMETLYGLKNPTPKTLEAIALRWSPHRTIACRVLWRARDTKK